MNTVDYSKINLSSRELGPMGLNPLNSTYNGSRPNGERIEY